MSDTEVVAVERDASGVTVTDAGGGHAASTGS